MPLLTVEREHKDGLSASLSLWSHKCERIILDLADALHLADVLTIGSINELGVEGNIMVERSVIILELLEADASDLDARVSGGGAGLRVQVVHKHLLVVSESVLNVTVVKGDIGTVVLAIAGRCEYDGVRDAHPR